MNSEWDRPSFSDSKQMVAWAERRAKWDKENPEMSADWKAALEENQTREEERFAQERLLHLQASMPRHLKSSGVPLRCIETLADIKQTLVLKSVREFLAGKMSFCLLLGAAGAGKSVAASWAVREYGFTALQKQRTILDPDYLPATNALFVRASDAARMSLYDKNDNKRHKALCEVGLLVLDDMGTEQASSTWASLLDEIIDSRYGEKLRTILTTNLDVEAFKARYGERVSDRIRHDGLILGAGSASLRGRASNSQ